MHILSKECIATFVCPEYIKKHYPSSMDEIKRELELRFISDNHPDVDKYRKENNIPTIEKEVIVTKHNGWSPKFFIGDQRDTEVEGLINFRTKDGKGWY